MARKRLLSRLAASMILITISGFSFKIKSLAVISSIENGVRL